MKTMTLTGIGSEQDLINEVSSYFLVFNKGELRVPVSEAAAEAVLKEMYGSSVRSTEQEPVEEQAPDQTSQSYDDDDVDQI